MRCKNCDYRLWNLKSRQCPECGTPFLPSEFEFQLNSVQFCCPHCNQSYYGTGENGHVVPPEFDCVSCRRRIHMDEMVLLPTEGVEEHQTNVDAMPWLERHRTGVIKGWLATVGRALVAPGRLIKSVPNDSSVGSALWFAVVTNALVCLAGMIFLMIFPLLFALSMTAPTGPGGGPMGPGPPGMTAGAVGQIIGSLVGFSLGAIVVLNALMLLVAVVAHGLLRITGPTESTIGRTVHAVCYSSGANVATAIPCIGFYFGWIWWLISAVLMVRTGQRVHGGRAAFAVLTTPILTIGMIIAVNVWVIFSAMSGAGPFAMSGATAPTQTVLTGLLDYAEDRDELPEHAIQLVVGEFVTGFELVATGSKTLESDVPLADTDLGDFTDLSSEDESQAVQAAIGALPPGTIAHRLGDFVFTYHGIDLASADPGLWLVIASPDPDVNPTGGSGTVITLSGPGMTKTSTSSNGGMVTVGLVDGTVTPLFFGAFSAQLSAQNGLRAKYNLPPMPDPATVTHAKPAVAGNPPPAGDTIPDPPEPDDTSSPEDENP